MPPRAFENRGEAMIRLLLAFPGSHSRAGSPHSGGGRRPRACRSAPPCARRGRAARWFGSSASAASCSCAWPRSSESALFGLHRSRGNRRPVRAGFRLEERPVREAASFPRSSALGLKRSQAQQGEPVRMALAWPGRQIADRRYLRQGLNGQVLMVALRQPRRCANISIHLAPHLKEPRCHPPGQRQPRSTCNQALNHALAPAIY